MNGYTQLCASILTSTIWREDLPTKVVWITLLALSDSEGRVEGSIPGLAHFAGVSVDECETSLSKLSQPDKYSRTPDHEGRRIEAIDGGWFILNRAKYRDKNWREGKVARHREANRRYYERKKTSDNSNPKISESDGVGDKTETETETETETNQKQERAPNGAPRSRATQYPDGFQPNEKHKALAAELTLDLDVAVAKFADYHLSKGSTFKDWDRALSTWLRREEEFSRGSKRRESPPAKQASAWEKTKRLLEDNAGVV